ncbi:hypothetical protein [Sulfurimonas sp.]|uniref:hypothetical protein n=1 Tax=Sulfurimonas sp. TaxID=2022749 RepID=UPI003D153199
MNTNFKQLTDREILTNSILNVYKTHMLSRHQTAIILNKSIQTLDRYRYDSIGPSYLSINGSIIYPITSVVDWIIKNTIHTTNSQGLYNE